MTILQDIQARLNEGRPIYDAIQQMHAEWLELQSVDQANTEYARLMNEEDKALEFLTQRKQSLEADKRKLTLPYETIQERPVPRPVSGHDRSPSHLPKFRSLAPRPNREAILATRSQLKKMVNRWAYSWRLEPAVQSQINCIADDPNRPLGEALILLDWSVYENRALTHENETSHLARLIEWGQALLEYRDQLAAEIDTLKTRFRRVLPIWELWRKRETVEGRQAWEGHIAEARRIKQGEIARLKDRIADLETELVGLRARTNNGGSRHE
jgi:hypothetical protein